MKKKENRVKPTSSYHYWWIEALGSLLIPISAFMPWIGVKSYYGISVDRSSNSVKSLIEAVQDADDTLFTVLVCSFILLSIVNLIIKCLRKRTIVLSIILILYILGGTFLTMAAFAHAHANGEAGIGFYMTLCSLACLFFGMIITACSKKKSRRATVPSPTPVDEKPATTVSESE